MSNRQWTSEARQRAVAAGYRSGLEEQISAELKEAGVVFKFEEDNLHYTVPARRAKYLPDFILDNGIIIETKGQFVTADRQKHLLIKEEHPNLDIRFVFSNPNTKIASQKTKKFKEWLAAEHGIKRLTQAVKVKYHKEWLETLTPAQRPSQTTYAMWCEKHGFQYAAQHVPMEWTFELRDHRKIEALKEAGIK